MMARIHRRRRREILLGFRNRSRQPLGVVNDGSQVDGSTSMEFHILDSSRDVVAFHSRLLRSMSIVDIQGYTCQRRSLMPSGQTTTSRNLSNIPRYFNTLVEFGGIWIPAPT
jgi:hypothetical protein